jgi:hypothetical protein
VIKQLQTLVSQCLEGREMLSGKLKKGRFQRKKTIRTATSVDGVSTTC